MGRGKGATTRFLLVLVGLLLIGSLLPWAAGARPSNLQQAGCWKARVTEQWINTDLVGSVLRVSVHDKVGLPVRVRSTGSFETWGLTGTKPEYGPFVAEFAALSRGIYYIEPRGLGIVFEVGLDGKGYTRVDFTPVPCAPTPTPIPPSPAPSPQVKIWPSPAPVTFIPVQPAPTQVPPPVQGWVGRVAEHYKNPSGGVMWATIAVRVIGRPAGQDVVIRSGDWSAIEKTGTKPEHGPDACEFGALRAGTYRLIPRDLGTQLDVVVEPGDFVLVEFYRTGQPISIWTGTVVENTSGDQMTEHVNSAIAVIVSGRPWHEVEIQSNGYHATAQTGYKPEYGPDACEFGGLRAGTYTITPKGLDTSLQVQVDGWGWALVRFDEVSVATWPPTGLPSQPTAVPTPPIAAVATALPQPSPTWAVPSWRGWVVSNSSGERLGIGVSSVIVVRVDNWVGVPVRITGGGGWQAGCTTGTKPEYGPDACEFGGLWPGTYYLRPEGADAQVEVTMDGQGIAFVTFVAQ